MKRLVFDKMSGAGNDFVLISAPVAARERPGLARRLCDRKRGVGADGLLVVERRGGLALDYYNADGSRAFCGNGSRCAAWWMFQKGWTRGRGEFEFRSLEGPIRARVRARESARVRMPPPGPIETSRSIEAAGRRYTGHFVRVGVPHFVVPVRGLDAYPVEEAGRLLRRHKAFAPAGTNVDFVAFEGGTVRMRTYERGVEAETLACGTGAAASALAGALTRGLRSPVRVLTRGGDTLTVTFTRAGKEPRLEDVWLEGPARTVFTGVMHV